MMWNDGWGMGAGGGTFARTSLAWRSIDARWKHGVCAPSD